MTTDTAGVHHYDGDGCPTGGYASGRVASAKLLEHARAMGGS